MTRATANRLVSSMANQNGQAKRDYCPVRKFSVEKRYWTERKR